MTAEIGTGTPKSPGARTPDATDELDPDLITHKGKWRKSAPGKPPRGGAHLGALEDETVPVMPPTSEDGGATSDDAVDPHEELSPG